MREKFSKILNDHGIIGEDIEDILCAVSDMLECAAKHIKDTEPYATNTIARLENAAREVYDLNDLV